MKELILWGVLVVALLIALFITAKRLGRALRASRRLPVDKPGK